MSALTVLLGGARAGKSTLALEHARSWAGGVTFIATAEARDDEMAARIARHRRERPDAWHTVEEPLELRAALAAADPEQLAIVDCLTLWVANVLERGDEPETVVAEAEAVAELAARRAAPVVVITNEVGLGIVPANELARSYRDLLGEVNRAFVVRADRAFLVVAGRALALEQSIDV